VRIEVFDQLGQDLTGVVALGLQLRQADEHRALFRLAVALNGGVFQVAAETVQGNRIAEPQRDVRAAGEVDAPVHAVFGEQREADDRPDHGEGDGVETPPYEVVFGGDENLQGGCLL